MYGMCQSYTQMIMNITCIDLFDHNVGKACTIVRVRCSWMGITVINLFDQNMVMTCAKF